MSRRSQAPRRIVLPDPRRPGLELRWELASQKASIPGLALAERKGQEHVEHALDEFVRWVLRVGASDDTAPHLPPPETRAAIRAILVEEGS